MQKQQQNCKMSDQVMMNDILNTEKQLVSMYSTYLCESACPQMRQVMSANFSQTAQDQFSTFTLMSQRGWYQVEPAEPQKVSQAKQSLSQIKSQL